VVVWKTEQLDVKKSNKKISGVKIKKIIRKSYFLIFYNTPTGCYIRIKIFKEKLKI